MSLIDEQEVTDAANNCGISLRQSSCSCIASKLDQQAMAKVQILVDAVMGIIDVAENTSELDAVHTPEAAMNVDAALTDILRAAQAAIKQFKEVE